MNAGSQRARGNGDSPEITALEGELSAAGIGELLRSGDARFNAAVRIWNAAAQTAPRLIATCADAAAVSAAVSAAARLKTPTAIRCGGHSLAGYGSCEGGLVIALDGLRRVTLDPEARTARFGGGCLLGDVDVATQRAGLVFPAGVVSHTGAGGLVIGGGTGWLTRQFGLSCDNVLAFEVVTASGERIRADERENADLYWALRGGGGNFGVVTEFTVRLHPLREALLATSYCFGEDISRVISAWRDFMPEAPDALKWNLGLRLAPPQAAIPVELHRQPSLQSAAAWYGESHAGECVLRQILAAGRHWDAAIRRVTYLDMQTMADGDFPHGRRYYTKSGYFQGLREAEIEAMVAALEAVPSANSQIELSYLGGAAGRVAASETAFGDRSAPLVVNLLADWSEPADDASNVGWVRALFARLRPAMRPGVYVNFMSGDEDDRVASETYRDRWERLVAIKTRYDPGNFFRRNQNIPPLPLRS